MSEGIILDAEDVKKIIAEKFGVDPKDIIKTQYSYIIKKTKDGIEPKGWKWGTTHLLPPLIFSTPVISTSQRVLFG